MIVFSFLLYMLLVGMGAGWLAWVILGRSKTLMRDRKPNWTLLFGLGVAGSFVGGLAASIIMGEGFALRPSGMIGSVLGSIVVVAIYVATQNR